MDKLTLKPVVTADEPAKPAPQTRLIGLRAVPEPYAAELARMVNAVLSRRGLR